MEKLSFRRLNFFKGLFTKAEDWLEEQRYHIEKRKLHHRCFYTPGVVIGEGSNLKITVDEGRVTVQPGYAIDDQGRDLYLSEPHALRPPPENEAPLYIYIAYDQRTTETRSNYTNPEYSGDAFTLEDPKVDWTKQAPDNKARIELARIDMRAGQRITDKQVDMSHIKYALSRRPGIRVQSGQNDLAPSTGHGLYFSEDDEKYLIGSFSDQSEAAGAFYVANVYPVLSQDAANARIFWRIETSIAEEKIRYYLLLKNFGEREVTVKWTVYRLNLGQIS